MPAKRCPACGTVNRPSAKVCDCGQRLDGQLEQDADRQELHARLAHKLVQGWLACIGGALLVIVVVAVSMAAASQGTLLVFWGFGFVGVGFTVRGAMTIATTRRRLRAIES